MKRQATISSFFAKQSAPATKKPKLNTSLSSTSSSSTTPEKTEQPNTVDGSNSISTNKRSDTSGQTRIPIKEKLATISSQLSQEELQNLHERFNQKFGSMDKEREEKRRQVDQLMTDILDDRTPPESSSSGTGKTSRMPLTPRQKFTPLEQQVVELKAKYSECLLLIEVGYKFRLFGEDAKIASRILHIAHFIDRNFYVASIPVHRLNVHARKLVNAGYRVGIVRQTETAALKAVGSNRSQPFKRELTEMITKGTMVDSLDDAFDESSRTNYGAGHLMCFLEQKRGGNGPDDRVLIGMVAIQPATGDIVYDEFEDTYLRQELETRFLHLEPSELLVLSEGLSRPTEKLIKNLNFGGSLNSKSHADDVRLELIPASKDVFGQDCKAAIQYVTEFFQESADTLSNVLNLPDMVIQALACLIRYLKEFHLDSIFLRSTKYFRHFVERSHMLLNGNALTHLEIYRNSTDFTEKGSLFSTLNHTQTKFGQRLLRTWIGRPLVDAQKLKERMDAIEELMTTDNPKKNLILSLLSRRQLPDLEKGICRIHYGKSTPLETIQVLEAFYKISSSVLPEPRLQSPYLNYLFDTLSAIQDDIQFFKNQINPRFIERQLQDKADFFESDSQWTDIPSEKNNIKLVEQELQEHLLQLQQSTGLKDQLKFTTVALVEYLLEVPNSRLKKVPMDWIKMSGTKAVSRFQDKFILDKLKERDLHRERLAIAVDTAYEAFLKSIAEKYERLREVVLCLAQLDCLFSLAMIASASNYVKPEFEQSEIRMEVTGSRHPMVEQSVGNTNSASAGSINSTSIYIPNDIHFTSKENTMVLTGPNMGGKSCYIRQVALIAIMAQIGSYVPATSAKLGLFDAVFTRMGASDRLMSGQSTFMVEMQETSDIMKRATSRSLVILDELGRGTSTHDGQAIAYAVLNHFIKHIQPVTLFVTHYPSLSKVVSLYPGQVRNCYMDYIEEKDDETGIGHVIFLYKLVNGIAMNSYGMNVAKLANIPVPIIRAAKKKSDQVKGEMEQRQLRNRRIRLMRQLMDYARSNCSNTKVVDSTDDFRLQLLDLL